MRLMGKFILNDLLSEGTVYTLDGQNIFDNQYFSFIGMTDDSFYCSTNVPDDKVIEFPRNVPVMNRDLLESAPMVEPEKQVLDVTNVCSLPFFITFNVYTKSSFLLNVFVTSIQFRL